MIIFSVTNEENSPITPVQISSASSNPAAPVEVPEDYISPIFDFKDNYVRAHHVYYVFANNQWYFSNVSGLWYDPKYSLALSDKSDYLVKLTNSLQGQSFRTGLDLLMNGVTDEPGTFLSRSSLSTDNVTMTYGRDFIYKYNNVAFYFTYSDKDGWQTSSASQNKPQNLIDSLDGREFYDGAQVIFMAAGKSPTTVVPLLLKGVPETTISTVNAGESTNLGSLSSVDINNYQKYGSNFSGFAHLNLPNSLLPQLPSSAETTRANPYWTERDFESLLLAIAQENNWGTNGDFILGYHTEADSYKSAVNQLAVVSAILSTAFEGSGNSLGTQTGSKISYQVCNSQSGSKLSDQLNCVLSVYHTGKPLTNEGLFGGKNTEGINYADDVISKWEDWYNYLSSSSGGSGGTSQFTTQ